MNRIWKRYFFAELMKVFFLFMGCFFFLYVLIDYSVHTKAFHSNEITYLNTLFYYLCQFTKRAEIIVPIALMVSSIKVLTTANIRNEIVALATGGISLKKVTRPFIGAALILSALLYLNSEFIQPFSLNKIEAFEEFYFKERAREGENKKVNALLLEDNTLLIYQAYDQERRAFFDVFWLQGCDRFYRIQSLFPYETVPFGKYVDTLIRNPEGEIIKIGSALEASFPEMKFETKALFNAVHPPRMQSLTQLAHYLNWKDTHFGLGKMNDKEAEGVTFFYFKLVSPLVCILAIIGTAPFCLRFNRNLSIFMIYALSLFGMVTFFTLANSSLILGESQVFPPAMSVLIPQLTLFLILGWRYAKL